MTIIDVIQETEWQQPLLDAIESIKTDTHHNAGNYTAFNDRIQQYDCLTILVNNGVIEAFSGLYNAGIYPSNTIRALDRTYYFNHAKHDSSFQPQYRYATQIMWPYQVNRAKELGYSSVFFSMQNIKKRRAFETVVNRCTPKPTILPVLGNTCRLINGQVNQDALCWQNIAIYTLRQSKFELPTLELTEYEEKYKHATPIR
jgi:hypothetical protein